MSEQRARGVRRDAGLAPRRRQDGPRSSACARTLDPIGARRDRGRTGRRPRTRSCQRRPSASRLVLGRGAFGATSSDPGARIPWRRDGTRKGALSRYRIDATDDHRREQALVSVRHSARCGGRDIRRGSAAIGAGVVWLWPSAPRKRWRAAPGGRWAGISCSHSTRRDSAWGCASAPRRARGGRVCG